MCELHFGVVWVAARHALGIRLVQWVVFELLHGFLCKLNGTIENVLEVLDGALVSVIHTLGSLRCRPSRQRAGGQRTLSAI
jgi:hypothetical protein